MMSSELTTPTSVKLSARQRGDFQTPKELAREVWASLDASRFNLVIEPTFGLGSFITTMPDQCRAAILGWELHETYYRETVALLSKEVERGEAKLLQGDVFTASSDDVSAATDANVLVIGNPPWVTNSEQGTLGGGNTGAKRNFKALPGFDAMTGKSNFDISEAIILHFVGLLKDRCCSVQFALLTKFSVVRNLIQFLASHTFIGDYEFHRINTALHFDAAVDAGLLKFKIDKSATLRKTCSIHASVGGAKVGEVGLVDGRMIYDLDVYRRTLFMENTGAGCYVWRQGLKHDLSRIMELSETAEGLRNGLGEIVDVEGASLYQLYKSSDIYHGRPSRYVVPIYQRDLKDMLEDLPTRFPKLHAYLKKHEADFKARKSSIYKNRPTFSIFGIGDYSHFTYKVAIGALYSEPLFRLLEPSPRPAIVDDTSYMLATNNYEEALYLLAIVNLDCTRDFLCSVSHPPEKRRFTKDVLARLLIPPFEHCPQELRHNISREWLCSRDFSAQLKGTLCSWLSNYKATDSECLNFDLFPDLNDATAKPDVTVST
jgi:hypothetical protein